MIVCKITCFYGLLIEANALFVPRPLQMLGQGMIMKMGQLKAVSCQPPAKNGVRSRDRNPMLAGSRVPFHSLLSVIES